jgi:Ran GTPase-activating protein (RanGAP) involved in mRNA processing and transport
MSNASKVSGSACQRKQKQRAQSPLSNEMQAATKLNLPRSTSIASASVSASVSQLGDNEDTSRSKSSTGGTGRKQPGTGTGRASAKGIATPTTTHTALSSARMKLPAPSSKVPSPILSAAVSASNSPRIKSRKNSSSNEVDIIESAIEEKEVSTPPTSTASVSPSRRGSNSSVPNKNKTSAKSDIKVNVPEIPLSDYDIVPESMIESIRDRSPSMKDRYFGDNARILFYNRLNFLAKSRINSCVNEDDELDSLAFDNEDMIENKEDPSAQYPFATNIKTLTSRKKEILLKEEKLEKTKQKKLKKDFRRIANEEKRIKRLELKQKQEFEIGDNSDPELRSEPDSDPDSEDNDVDTAADGEETKTKGEGENADKLDPFKLFKSPYENEFPEPGAEITQLLSPRSRFLAGCLKAKKNPRASLLLRKKLNKKIKLSHMAIGNEVASLLSECLCDMPYIEELDINNNALTDKGVAAILEAIVPIKTLKILNISRNKMDDDAADALAAYVKLDDCPCKSLIMQVSDVDDFEGERFVRCLMENQSITEIDLSDNLIGAAENMRTVIPDMCTCSEAFAEMLEVKECILKKLTLSWNTIRLSSSIRLCQSLRNNTSLTFLDLSYNSLSYDGGEALGDALLENSTLCHLDISSNNINASATFTISTGIIENKSLTRVIISNNPIGEAGAQALMQVPMTVGARCNLTAERCNCGLQDSKCWFSHSNPLGMHHLDLSKPYERAVAFALLELIANHATFIFVSAEYEAPNGQKTDLKLFQTVIEDEKEKFFDERQKSIVAGLRKMKDASGDREKGVQLFHEADEDGGGSIDHEELSDLLTSVGMDVTPDMIEDIMDLYDIDGEGAIGMPEFLAFLKSQYKEATTRLEEMTEERIMATLTQPNKKYQPPRQGKLHFYVMDGFTRKAKFSVMSSCDQDYAKTVSSDVATMLGFAVSNSKIRLGEAMQMFNTMYNEGGQKAQILAELVVKLADPSDCKKLVMKVTRGDKTQINLLKNAMGGAYKPYLGILNGYYSLDLSKQMDQIALTRLLEQSQTDNTTRQAMSPLSIGQMGDTSQCGNWSSFRNEFLNGKRFAVQPDRFRPMPKSGKLYFDYSMTQKPAIDKDTIILSDKRLVKILMNNFLVKENEIEKYLKKMTIWRKHLVIANKGKGKMLKIYEYDKEKGLNIGLACNEYYTRLEDRIQLFQLGFKRENVTVDYQGKKSNLKKNEKSKKKFDVTENSSSDINGTGSESGTGNNDNGTSSNGPNASTIETAPVPVDGVSDTSVPDGWAEGSTVIENGNESNVNSNGGVIEIDPETGEPVSMVRGSGGEGAVELDADGNPIPASDADADATPMPSRPPTAPAEGSKAHMKMKMDEEMAKYRMLIESPLVSPEAKSSRINEQLEDTFAHVWLLCRHVAAIVIATPLGTSGRTDYFGSYHVDLIVSLFARIVDIHNFEVIMSVLNAQECAQLYCRIGWLNLFNPTKPEGFYCLDFCRYEERLCAKMMIGLALVEPGDNWKDNSMRWTWDSDPVPGWELTVGYTKDETCNVKGIVQVRYYSGEGKGKDGCKCHGGFRKAMYSLVLADEHVAAIDFDEMFPYLVHGSGDSDESEDEAEKKKKKLLLLQAGAGGIDSEDEDDGDDIVVKEGERPLRHGEKFLRRNPTMWNELFAPPGGCVKQKNPLSLVFSTAIIQEDQI